MKRLASLKLVAVLVELVSKRMADLGTPFLAGKPVHRDRLGFGFVVPLTTGHNQFSLGEALVKRQAA